MSVVDVFVGNYPVIDWELYSLWVEGEAKQMHSVANFLFFQDLQFLKQSIS